MGVIELEKINFNSLITFIIKIATCLLVAGFLAMNFASILQVFSRHVLSQPLAWSEELARYLFVYVTYLGSIICIVNKAHIEINIIDILIEKKPAADQINRVIDLVKSVLLFLFLGWLAYLSFEFIMKIIHFGQKSPGLGVHMAIPYSSVFVGCLLMSLLYLREFIENLRGKPGK